jgi:hypothetical protein
MPEELVQVPADLKLLSDDELATLETKATEEFDRLNGQDDVTPEALEQLMSLTDGIERLRFEANARAARYREEQAAARLRLSSQRQDLEARVKGKSEGEGGTARTLATDAPLDVETIAAAAARGSTAALVAALGDGKLDLQGTMQKAAKLSDARKFAPSPAAPKKRMAITAAVDIPGLARNDELSNLAALGEAFHKRARSMTTTNDNPQFQLVASIRNEFEYTVDDRTSPGQMEELFNRLVNEDTKQALVAGGGWCAPSEIRYEFFNIAGGVRKVDLPTFGVTRGGIRFPTSPSIADAFGGGVGLAPFNATYSNASVPWIWTEADDQAAATGASPRKPTLRVPCPSFNERRLECYGLTITAGNLADDAYPEATTNFLKLVTAAHEHAMNSRTLAQMQALSAAAVTTGSYGTTGQPAYNAITGGVALAAVDYRAKYGMDEDAILEVILPVWIVDVIMADLAHRRDAEFAAVSEAQIQSWLNARGVRAQFVDDYQVRGASQFGNPGSNMTAWPTQVTFMLYAAGTFMYGNGLQLDLGVVRDSVLNAANDHTAAWSEECHLVAMVGHESRQYTVKFAVAGETAPTSNVAL